MYISRDLNNNITGYFEHLQPGIAEEYFDGPLPESNRPDINGFKTAMVTALGGIVAVNNLIKLYPVFLTSLSDMKWDNVEALVVDALQTNAIDQTQYSAFQAAFLANNIPVTLP